MLTRTISRRGLLYLIGGAEDRHNDALVLKQMIAVTQPGVIVVVPTASSYPQSINRDYTDVFRRLGVPEIKCLDIRYRDEVDRDENLKAVETADLVFFGGGDQVRLVDTLKQTGFIDLIRRRFETGGLHIAVTKPEPMTLNRKSGQIMMPVSSSSPIPFWQRPLTNNCANRESRPRA